MNKHIANLKINQLELLVILGWAETERLKPQLVQVDIEIFFSHPPKACLSDYLDDTFCYDALIKKIKSNIEKRQFKLVEFLAQEIYSQVKLFLNEKIIIRVYKKPQISVLTGGVCFSYGDK